MSIKLKVKIEKLFWSPRGILYTFHDGKVTISWKEFYSGLPRIIMAVFLGVVISTPLELKIYEDGIENEIGKRRRGGREYISSLPACKG